MANLLKAKKGSVVIRMYRAHFGDCFLLAFPARNNQTKYMLIDCGVHHQYKQKKALMKQIAADINADTGGKLDVVVATHEHTDHILGFSAATAEFKKMKISDVWMGWTEEYDNPDVKSLDKIKKRYLQGLNTAAALVEGHDPDYAKQLKGVLGFYNERLAATDPKKPKHMYNRQTMEWLQGRAKSGPTFCTPGEDPLTIKGVDGVRFFVLGPPTDSKALKKSTPSRGSKKETYLTDEPSELLDSFVSSVISLKSSRGVPSTSEHTKAPFAECYGSPAHGTRSGKKMDLYNDQNSAWRKIDSHWLELATELAIKMETHTNNSSLALAIELGKNGKVLLFPGDAQVGNWLSWQKLKWDLGDRVVTADDLLARTVVYKVGHHGSHNATLKKHGLEKMTSPDLTALIPVNEEYARTERKWPIPDDKLVARLKEKCCRRVLRADDENPKEIEKPEGITARRWREFLNRVDSQKSYMDYTVKWK